MVFKIPTVKNRSDKHEQTVAKRLGGKVTRGSGNGRDKGDVNTQKLKIECKTTGFDSYRLETAILAKIETEATSMGKVAVMNIQFEKSGHRYVVISEENFEELTGLRA